MTTSLLSRPRLLAPALGVALGLAMSGCGGEDDKPSTDPSVDASSEEQTSDAAVPDEAGAAAAVVAYFDAMRLGDAEKVCALESEEYQTFRYNATGQACLDNYANNTEQAIYADPVVVVSTKVAGEFSDVVVQPSSYDDDQEMVSLQFVDGAWLIKMYA